MQWENLKEISIIYPDKETEQEMLTAIKKADALEAELKQVRNLAASIVEEKYSLSQEKAIDILQAFKPPK